MSTAAAARQALSPFRRLEGARRASTGPLGSLQLGHSLAVRAEKGRLPAPPRLISTPSANKTSSSAEVPAERVSFPHPQRAMVSGKAARDGQRQLARRGPPNAKGLLSVAKLQAGKKAAPSSATIKFKIPRSVPNPFPYRPTLPAIRSAPRDGTTAARDLQLGKVASSRVNDHVNSGSGDHARDGSGLSKHAMVGAAEQRKRSPSRPSMNIDLLLNPSDEPPARDKIPYSFIRVGPAAPSSVGMQSTRGAAGSKGFGGSLNSLLNHEMPYTAVPGTLSSHHNVSSPHALGRVQGSAEEQKRPSKSRGSASRNAMDLVDELLREVDRIAAARAHASRVSRPAQTDELRCGGANLRTGSADPHPPSTSLERNSAIGGLRHEVSVTEPQVFAAVLTHDPEINTAGQESKSEHSHSSTRAQRNGGSGHLPLRLRLKLRDTRTPSKANVRGAAEKKEFRQTEAGVAPTRANQRESGQPQQSSKVAAEVADAEVSQKRKKAGRSTHKRRINHVSNLKWDQDKTGRLTKPIVFPDSQTPVTLRNYKRKALSFEEKLRGSLPGDSSFDIESLKEIAKKSGDDWMRNPDTLEHIFWTAIEKGVEGVPVVVPYGVDVEVEGAFDSMGMSYVEWYGDGDKEGQRSKKKKATARKAKDVSYEGPQPHAPSNMGEEKQADGQVAHVANAPGSLSRAQGSSKPPCSSALPGKEPKKHPRPTAPKSHVGNLNNKGLLRHMPRMPGINHSMYYVGQLLSRFCWHVEDAFLNSVSYLHPGGAPKIWYAVPPSDATKFDDYATSNIFSDELLDEVGSGQFLLANKTTMFNPRKLVAAGVQVYRVVHKPGSFVLTAPKGYHAGFNCGYNVAEAVNYANPAWFPVGREASRFARTLAKPLCVPWEYLLFHEAKATRDITLGKREGQTAEGLKKDSKILAQELYQVVSQGESAIRAYADRTNCRIATLNEVPALVQNNQLGPEFGHGAGLVCSICGHSCHFYAEICGSCDDSFEARCVEHFGQGHRMCLNKDHKTILVRRHDPVLVADILTKLEDVAGIKRSTAELLDRYTRYLRAWETPLKRSGLRLKLNFSLAASRLPPVMAGKPKHSKENSHRDKGRKGKKRAEVDVTEDADSDHEGEKKAKRRKVAKRQVEAEKRPSVEPVVPLTIPKLEAICDVPEGSSPVPVRTCHIFPGMDRMALKASYMERKKRASLKPVEEESDDGSEYFVVPSDRRP